MEREPSLPGSAGQMNEQERQRNTRTQFWCFTFTNLGGRVADKSLEDEEIYRRYRIPPETLEQLELWRYQPERGANEEEPEVAGRLHIQGFIKTKRKGLRYNQLTQMFGLEGYQVHWEAARAFSSSWDYCGKENTRLPGGRNLSGGSPVGLTWMFNQLHLNHLPHVHFQ